MLDQRIDRSRLWLHQPEMADVGAQIVDDLIAPDAGGFGHVQTDQLFEMLHIVQHALVGEAVNVDELVVVAIDEAALHVEHVGKAAGEAGAEVQAGAAQNTDHAAGHVLAAVIAGTLDDRDRARVAHREALAGLAGREQLAAGGAIQAGVAHDDGIARDVARGLGRLEHQAARGHALADIVIGIAFQVHVQPTGIPDTEALADVALEMHHQWRLGHAVVAPVPHDLTRDARADRAVEVLDLILPFTAGLARDRGQHVGEHALGQLAAIERRVRGLDAHVRAIGHQPAIRQQRPQIELALLGGLTRQNLQVLGTADQIDHAPHAQTRHDFAAFFGHEAEIVHHHLRHAEKELLPQHRVLRQKFFLGMPEMVMNYFRFVAEECREVMASLGVRRMVDLIGRTEYLEILPGETSKQRKLDLRPLLSDGGLVSDRSHVCIEPSNAPFDRGELAERMLVDMLPAITRQSGGEWQYEVKNFNRSIGARISGEIARHWGNYGMAEASLVVHLKGNIGQSFGVWNAGGLHMYLEGDANDYVGKGMAAGRLVLKPPKAVGYIARDTIIMGNTCLYGATGGQLFAAMP